jgi:hypothetical protein
MRWPRVTRFYRAYSEFDKYSDTECLGLALQARVRRGDAAWVVPLGLALTLGLVVGAFGYMTSLLVIMSAGGGKTPVAGAVGGPVGMPPGTVPNVGPLTKVLMTGVLAGVIGTVILAFILIQREMLVRTMRKIIARALCPYCEFSLVGLAARRGELRCPECGNRVVLAEHRISEDDLIPDTAEGLRAMRERWRSMGADPLGAYTGGKGETAGPRGEHREQWAKVARGAPSPAGSVPKPQGGQHDSAGSHGPTTR